MFEKSLTDLIRGIRANKRNEAKYVAACVDEIRRELKQNDPDVKAQAVSKLTYLNMLGNEMGWAAFHIVEVMSSPNFANKRTGYLAAAQSFRQDTEVLMLTTNLLRKDLSSSNYVEVGLAVAGLADIMTPDLGRDLGQDMVGLLQHTRPYVRKRAVVALYKASLKYPDVLRMAWPKMKEMLDDPDPAVVSATTNVVCELACRNPENYLVLAPHMFSLLTSTANNWMLIKIVKMFRAMTPLEPRLAKKLLHPITNIIRTTPALSLLYECVLTAISSGMLNVGGGGELARLCVDKLRRFLEDADQNLKYIGLLALGKILDIHPDLVAEHRDIVLQCVDDPDYSIRSRALDLVSGMVTRRDLPEIVKRLMGHLQSTSRASSQTAITSLRAYTGDVAGTQAQQDRLSPFSLDVTFQADVIRCVVGACSANGYAFISSFDWYLAVLVELAYAATRNPARDLGHLISAQLMDVAVRVKSARNTAVRLMVHLLADVSLLESAAKSTSGALVLGAAAWICGEYCGFLPDAAEVLIQMVNPQVACLPGSVQQVFVHNSLKIFVHWLGTLGYPNAEVVTEISSVGGALREKLEPFTFSSHIEVQERACSAVAVLRLVLANFPPSPGPETTPSATSSAAAALSARFASFRPLFFSADLNPVAPQAQRKVPVPDGLVLSQWIHEEAADAGRPPPAYESHAFKPATTNTWWGDAMFEGGAVDVGRGSRRGDAEQKLSGRVDGAKSGPFYLPSGTGVVEFRGGPGYDPVDDIPIVSLTLDHASGAVGWVPQRVEPNPPPPPAEVVEINRSDEMPESAVLSNEERDGAGAGAAAQNVGPAGGKDAGRRKGKKKRDVLDVDHDVLKAVDLRKPPPESVPVRSLPGESHSAFTLPRPQDQPAQAESAGPAGRQDRRWFEMPRDLATAQGLPIVHSTTRKKKTKKKEKEGEGEGGGGDPTASKARKTKKKKGIKGSESVQAPVAPTPSTTL